ncbi:2671_t:CDS:2 [Funneliformis geosporum]|uniref:2671_t:CDS:1 n=1 Tax=Funneliformis geosporum TaxID=1117311 RepID=A0A9W4WMR8_9GLOM|nr:2671_t:CDS:2 [Funneliformis geosporum]
MNQKENYYIIADHLRTAIFALADGAAFEPKGRGYILKKLVKKATLLAYLINLNGEKLQKISEKLIEVNSSYYRHLKEKENLIISELKREIDKSTEFIDKSIRELDNLVLDKRNSNFSFFTILIILFNGNITTGFKSPQKLLNDLSEIKKVSRSDLKAFLTQDHTAFSVLNVSTKHIESTNRISVSLTKNSARSFYLNQSKSPLNKAPIQPPIIDDCLQDANNCTYFAFFNSKEKKLYTRFKDKVEANFEGTHRSPGYKTISSYLAKYLSKSFHLRSLYTKHGLANNHKTYRFFKNLYQYQQKPALLIAKHRLDAQSGLPLPKNQKIFRQFNYQTSQTTYFYRSQEKLVGNAAKPILIKKNYRLGTRSLNPLSLLKLATKSPQKEAYFQNVYHHFQTKPVFHFTFEPEKASVIRAFMDKLDTYAAEYDMEESKEFLAYPISHNYQHQTIQQRGDLCGCETQARNQYLDNWSLDYFHPSTDN